MKEVKHKNIHRLWLRFSILIFAVIVTTIILASFMTYRLYMSGSFSNVKLGPLAPLLLLIIISAAAGSTISFFVGRKILDPISEMGNASKEVAKGNFTIRLSEEQKVDEVREIYKIFNSMVEELGSIETLRDDFVVSVSHEFKTPIATIEGYATLLQTPDITQEEHEEYTRLIIDSVRQLATLTGNVLMLSRLENQGTGTNRRIYRLDEQIRQALLLLEPEWTRKEISLDIDLPKLDYFGNKELMMQVWMNLLGNAVKFTGTAGDIQISLKRKDDMFCITVSDNGSGMSKETQNHIFDKFYQGDRSRNTGGNGLGLALVRKIIDIENGFVEVESEIGQGSSFHVWLWDVSKEKQ